MKKLILSKTSLEVSEICLGGDGFGSKLDRDAAFRIIDRFREGGGNFIDTANIYVRDQSAGYSVSERIIGEYLKSRGKDSLIVATKGAHPQLVSMHIPRVSKTEIERDLDESLKTLGLDCIDFYWLHRDNPAIPIGEILEIMEDFVRAGKLRFYGGSNYAANRVLEAGEYAKAHGINGFAAISNMWSPAVQNPGASLVTGTLIGFTDADLKVTARAGMAFVPYNSTAKGWFAKKAAGNSNAKLDAIFENETNLALLDKLIKTGGSVQKALISYIRSYPMQIVPITSVSNIGQLDDIM